MMFKKDVLDSVAIEGNIFDPDYFAYFEESDMCHRVWLAGYRIVYGYKSVIYHKMGATSSGMNSAFIQYHSFKNRIRTYIKNFGVGWLCLYLPVHLAVSALYIIISYLRRHGDVGWAIVRAYWWNIVSFGSTLQLRKLVQGKIRQVSDNNLSSVIIRTPSIKYYIGLLSGRVEE